MDIVSLVVLGNMTGVIVVGAIFAYLIRSGKWPRKRPPPEENGQAPLVPPAS